VQSARDSRWEQLDAPSKAALRWAAAVAQVRTGAVRPDTAALDSFDLLAGILLADLRGNPARELLDYFGIPFGAVLRRDGRHPLPAQALLTEVDRVPDDGLPDAEPATASMIDDVMASPRTEPDRLISLRELFGALLSQTRLPAATVIRECLSVQGLDPLQVITAYRAYLAGRVSQADFLTEHFPARGGRVEQLPRYLPDQPRPRAATPQELPDLVGIGAEIDAFAYLITSTQLVPPLAIGLFGDWGSGKSYFLRSLQHRVDCVAEAVEKAGQDKPPYHNRIVQIEFNAWQYVEGDLWASLLEHLFRNLRVTGPDSDDLFGAEQRHWIQQLQHAGNAQQDALRERDRLEDEHRTAEAEVTLRRLARDDAVAEVARQHEQHPLRGWRVPSSLADKARKVAARAGVDAVTEQGEQLAAGLREAKRAVEGAATVLAPLRAKGWRYTVAVVLVLLLPAVAAVLVDRLDLSAVSSVATWVTSLLAVLVGYVRFATSFVTKTTAAIAEAQEQLRAAEAEQVGQLDEHVRAAQDALRTVEQELAEAVADEQRKAAEVAKAEAELTKVTPRRVLTEFIADRLGSDDYRSRLGVPALVRRDLERLSRLVAAQQGGPAAAGEYSIDRIVLYIDDLDRCPTTLVIKVLEAVHLLLAFPLFVVVVAVDSRWLASSLREHYAQLAGDDAAPDDFLEKIFQVPFLVQPLPSQVRRQMLRGLLISDLTTQAAAPTIGVGAVAHPHLEDLTEFRRVVDSFTTTDRWASTSLAAAPLTVTADELGHIEDAAELTGPTPRAIKRYANIYLLAKSIGLRQDWTLPPAGQLAVLLAIATGLPGLADVLFPALAKDRRTPLLLGEVVPAHETGNHAKLTAAISILHGWLDEQPRRKQLDMANLAQWIDLIARFRPSHRDN
jgi:hypothetical protein